MHPIRYGLTITLIPRLELVKNGPSAQEERAHLERCTLAITKELPRIPAAQESPFTSFIEQADLRRVLTVPPGVHATCTLHRNLTSRTFSELLAIHVGAGSTLSLIDTQQSTNTLHTALVEVHLAPRSRARIAIIQQHQDSLTQYRAHLAQDAVIDWFLATGNTGFTQAITENHADGIRSEANSHGVILGSRDAQFDIAASTFHRGNQSVSDMHTRAVLNDHAKALYRGLLDIDADADGCQGYQTMEAVLVGQATADAIPNLQIRNNDVRCSHGVTIGRVDEEQVFYLQSRGVPRDDAITIITEGFLAPLLEKRGWNELQEPVRTLLQEGHA